MRFIEIYQKVYEIYRVIRPSRHQGSVHLRYSPRASQKQAVGRPGTGVCHVILRF